MSKSSSKVSNENKQGMFFRLKHAQKWILGLELRKSASESALPRYHMYQFSGKTDNFDFLSPNLPQKKFWGQNFQDISPDSESAPLRYHVCQFSDKTDIFHFFSPNLPKHRFRVRNSES